MVLHLGPKTFFFWYHFGAIMRTDKSPLLPVAINRDADTPLHRQVFDQVRDAILSGRLTPGWRLPSSRALATELLVSRNTILAAYDQLFAEGYTEGEIGSGTRVSRVLPEEVLATRSAIDRSRLTGTLKNVRLSRVARDLIGNRPGRRVSSGHNAFRPGVPEIDRFPWPLWSRLSAKFWRHPPRDLLSYGEAAGYAPLREAIADYLRSVRGLICEPDQVIITAGAQQAIDLTARVLIDPGDRVWIEDPGYAGIRGVLKAAGAELVPLPVDRDGLVVSEGLKCSPKARMAVVTPSHQYPLGSVMSLSRRLELLEWARENDAWILEDDYDSEYRYGGRPLSALQGLDNSGRVIYVGTFSKVLFPGIRLGYMVVPPGLSEDFIAVRRSLDDQTPIAMQPVLTEFILSGHFAAHIRRMRTLYAERQSVLLDALEEQLSDLLSAHPDDAGMHIVADIDAESGLRDTEIATEAAKQKITVYPLSGFFISKPNRNGLVFGYAGVEAKDIRKSVKRLSQLIRG